MKKENKLQKYEKFRDYLCEKYNRKCFTNPMGKCPLANFGCYDFFSFATLYRHTVNGRIALMRATNKAMKDEGYSPEEGL